MPVVKKDVKLVVYSIIFTLVINFILYNFRVLTLYIFNIDIGVFKYVDQGRLVAYFFFGVVVVKSNGSIVKNFLILFIPVFLVDSTTLLFGRDLIPLRFPYATIYPLLGIFCGLYFRRNKIAFSIFGLFSIIFIFASQRWIEPELLWLIREKTLPEKKQYSIASRSFSTLDSTSVRLSDTINENSCLLEFYFVGCRPCEEKYEALKVINNSFPNLAIILICDGMANDFSTFKAHAIKNEFDDIIFLYDDSRVIESLKLSGYPTEFLLKKGEIFHVDVGFSNRIKDRWLEKEKSLITKIISNGKN